MQVAGMVGFHNEVGDAALNNWVSPSSEQIAFGRGMDLLSQLDSDPLIWFISL